MANPPWPPAAAARLPLPQLAVPTAIPAATTAPTAAEAAPSALPATAPAAPAEATPAASQAAPVPLTGQGQTFQVGLTDNAFNPVDITIPVGSKVVWTNDGQTSHTVTADDGSFTSGPLKNGDVFEHVFDQAGTFLYHCEFHGGPNGQGMAAALTVSPGSAQPARRRRRPPPQPKPLRPQLRQSPPNPPPPAAPQPTQPAAAAPPAQAFTLTGGLNRDAAQPAFNPAVTGRDHHGRRAG